MAEIDLSITLVYFLELCMQFLYIHIRFCGRLRAARFHGNGQSRASRCKQTSGVIQSEWYYARLFTSGKRGKARFHGNGRENTRVDDRRTIYVYTKIAYRAPKSIPKLLINQFLPRLWIRALNFKVYPRITGPNVMTIEIVI